MSVRSRTRPSRSVLRPEQVAGARHDRVDGGRAGNRGRRTDRDTGGAQRAISGVGEIERDVLILDAQDDARPERVFESPTDGPPVDELFGRSGAPDRAAHRERGVAARPTALYEHEGFIPRVADARLYRR